MNLGRKERAALTLKAFDGALPSLIPDRNRFDLSMINPGCAQGPRKRRRGRNSRTSDSTSKSLRAFRAFPCRPSFPWPLCGPKNTTVMHSASILSWFDQPQSPTATATATESDTASSVLTRPKSGVVVTTSVAQRGAHPQAGLAQPVQPGTWNVETGIRPASIALMREWQDMHPLPAPVMRMTSRTEFGRFSSMAHCT